MIGTKIKGTLMILLSAIFFGLMPFFALKIYAEGFDVNNLLLYRFGFAFIWIVLFCLYKRIDIRINKKQFFLILFVTTIGTMLTTYTLFLSYQYISSGLASTLHFVYPILTIALASLIYKERFTVRKMMALFLSIIGIGLLSIGRDSDLNMIGIIWALVSGLLYAIYIIGMAHKDLKKISPYSVAFWIFGITTLLFLCKCIFTDQINTNFTPKSLFYILNLSVWSTFLAVVLFYKGMKLIGPGKASLLSTLEPLTGVIVGILVFNEKMDMKSSLAIVLILTSVLIVVQTKENRFRLLFHKIRQNRLKKA
ncbi:DMT family transporter [Ancylomarina sp.]|uniref:DMT family transporter n=1 Tax=Ancylomarina sp. TaxID=1970196 RepID=UPI00356161F0